MVLEDFTTFTEMDNANNRITIDSAVQITATPYRNDAQAVYCYKDYGANHFNDFTHYFSSKCDYAMGYCHNYVWLISRNLGAIFAIRGDSYINVHQYLHSTLGERRIVLEDWDGVGGHSDSYVGAGINTRYYYTIIRSGANTTLLIYDDNLRTSLVDTLTLGNVADDMQYLMPVNNYVSGYNAHATQVVYDYDLNETTTTTDKNIPTYFNSKFITHH